MNTLDFILYALISILGVMVLCIVGFWALVIRKYNIKVTVRELVRGRVVKRQTKAKETNKNGIPSLKILKYKKYFCPRPPSEAIELDHKGRKCIEVYFTPNGEFIFLEDRISLLEDGSLIKLKDVTSKETEFVVTELGLIPKESYEEWLTQYDKASRKEKGELEKVLKGLVVADVDSGKFVYLRDNNTKGIDTLEPFTTNQRALLVDQYAKADEDLGQGFFSKHAALVVGAFAIVIFLVIGLMILDSWNENQEKFWEHEEKFYNAQKEASQNYGSMWTDIQQLKGEMTPKGNNGEPPN